MAATPDRSSVAASDTVTGALLQPLGTPDAVVTGARRSTLMPATVALELFPARSATEAEAERLAPLAAIVVSAGQAATPERLSPQVQWMTTSPLYQPLTFGAVVAAPLMLGAVLSILMPLTAAVAALPALSATVTGPAPTLAPSPVMTLTAGQVPSTPESASLQTHCTATSPLYQPFAFAAGYVGVMTGGVRSMFTSVTAARLLFPALSVAVPLTLWPAPSLLRTVDAGVQLAIPDSASAQLKVTVTGELFQPLEFAAGVRAPAIAGGMLSILMVIVFWA